MLEKMIAHDFIATGGWKMSNTLDLAGSSDFVTKVSATL